MSNPVIYLDLDGVCCDFSGPASRLCGASDTFVPRRWAFYEDIFVSEAEFWATVDKAGWQFWADLPEFPWFKPMYRALKKQGKVIFLTTPSQNPKSAYGKLVWLKRRFGKGFGDFIITSHKELLARGPRTILVDDSTSNVEKFRQAGGKAFLFPQPWNDSDWQPSATGWKVT
jgi:5'(3')-deoxyribonucleotidase